MPENSLRFLDENIWLVETDNAFLGANIGARSTLVRLNDGSVWVHAPIDLTPELRAEVEAIGAVRFLVAPNAFHFKCLK